MYQINEQSLIHNNCSFIEIIGSIQQK